MHHSTFSYLKPTDAQMAQMDRVRQAARDYCDVLELVVPPGPDKTYLLRKLREVGMWANIAITRQPNGEPRHDPPDYPPEHPAPGDLGTVPL